MTLMHDFTIHQMSNMLRNLQHWIDKAVEHAEHKGFDANNFVQMRLAPDMFTFGRQVQSACDSAKFAASRSAGIEAPKHEDDETTLDELRARIQSTLQFLESVGPDKLEGSEDREVKLAFMPGKGIKAKHYVADFAQPNFFFHVTTAYAILRSCGVTLGKRDFIRDMRAYDLPE